MSDVVKFYNGSKKNYDSSTMQGGVYFSKDSKEIFLNGESYGNAVPADEEDITATSGSLKLKDREVDADNFQSKGYVILRKNIVDGKNILTQDMINQPNTIYEIRYDFDLNGKELQCLSSSKIVFNGGTITNGILKLSEVSELKYSWYTDLTTALSNMKANSLELDGEYITINVELPIIHKGFLEIKNFIFNWVGESKTYDYQSDRNLYPTEDNPGMLRNCILYLPTLVYYSKIRNCTFQNAMFGVVWYSPHNSPIIEECTFNSLDSAIFCYNGCLNYRILGITATRCSNVFCSSATCYPEDHPLKYNDNYYTDGLVFSSSLNKQINISLPSSNASFDTWFKECILKPTTPSYAANNSGYIYEYLYDRNLNISGHIIYIPFRNKRNMFGGIINFDFRGTVNNDLCYIYTNLVSVTIDGWIEGSNTSNYYRLLAKSADKGCSLSSVFGYVDYIQSNQAHTTQITSLLLRNPNDKIVQYLESEGNSLDRCDITNIGHLYRETPSGVEKICFAKKTLYVHSNNGFTKNWRLWLYGYNGYVKVTLPYVNLFGKPYQFIGYIQSANTPITLGEGSTNTTLVIKLTNTSYETIPKYLKVNNIIYKILDYNQISYGTFLLTVDKVLPNTITSISTIPTGTYISGNLKNVYIYMVNDSFYFKQDCLNIKDIKIDLFENIPPEFESKISQTAYDDMIKKYGVGIYYITDSDSTVKRENSSLLYEEYYNISFENISNKWTTIE